MDAKPLCPAILRLLVGMTIVLVAAACAPAPAPVPTAPPPTAASQPPAATQAPATSAPAVTTAPTSSVAGKPAAPVATAASRPNLSGELTMNTWRDITADPKLPYYSFHLLVQQWVKNHPGVKVTYQPMLGTVTDIFGYITTNLRSKTLADTVMQVFPSPAQLDPDLQYDFGPDLAKPNPYSTNKTWKDDFPVSGIALRDVTVNNKVLMVGTTFVGDLGDGAILYNQDILDKAGVKSLPKTWAEFTDALKKVKAAGYQPYYMPTVGNENYIFAWQTGILGDQLLGDVIKQCDGVAGEKADGRITQKEATYCIKKGIWSSQNPGMRTLFQTIKDLSPYYNDGYLAPPPPGDPFLQGKLAFRWIVRINLSTVETNPDVKFKWGSFYLPPLQGTAGTPGGIVHRYGNADAGAGSQYYFIPKTTVDKGKLDLALDLAQYITSPQAEAYWCSLQEVPCFTPGTPVEKIFPGNTKMQDVYRGFADPPALNDRVSGLDINNAFGQANSVQEIKIYQDYLAGTTTIDQALDAWERLATQLADNAIRQHPEWNADKW